MPSVVVSVGPPGSGKGTLANKLAEVSSIVHFCPGQVYRDHIKNKTPIGLEIKSYLDIGRLAPDHITINIVKAELKTQKVKDHGIFLDGFPRTVAQAMALDEMAEVTAIAVIQCEPEELKTRICSRWSCPQCGKDYNTQFQPMWPKTPGVCDLDSTLLTQRPDDTAEMFPKRWDTYCDQSAPLLQYYGDKAINFIGSEIYGTDAKRLAELLGITE